MDKAAIAEWILRQLTSRQKAATMAGDLVEISVQRGRLWFWLSVARLAFTQAWRYFVAYVVALFAFAWSLHGYEMALIGINAAHRRPEAWGPFFEVVQGLGAVMCAAALHNAIRFGLRDRMTQLSLLLAATCATIVFGWWLPLVAVACGLPVLWMLWQVTREVEWRRAAAALLCVFVSSILAYFGAMYGVTAYQHSLRRGPWGSQQLIEHPSVQWAGLAAFLFAVWSITAACSITHRLAMPRSGIEEGPADPGTPTAPSVSI